MKVGQKYRHVSTECKWYESGDVCTLLRLGDGGCGPKFSKGSKYPTLDLHDRADHWEELKPQSMTPAAIAGLVEGKLYRFIGKPGTDQYEEGKYTPGNLYRFFKDDGSHNPAFECNPREQHQCHGVPSSDSSTGYYGYSHISNWQDRDVQSVVAGDSIVAGEDVCSNGVNIIFEVGDLVEVVGEADMRQEHRGNDLYTRNCKRRGRITEDLRPRYDAFRIGFIPNYTDDYELRDEFNIPPDELILIAKRGEIIKESKPREESSAEKGFTTGLKFDPPLKIPAGCAVEMGFAVDVAGGPDQTVFYKITKPMSAYQKISRSLRKMLDPDTKVLVQAGYLNEELSLTGTGQQVLLEILKGIHKKELVAEAKADLKFKKETSEEND